METKNAVIKSATITCGDRGFLDCWLDLDYGGTGQGFGGYVLYLPKSFAHHEVNSPAGHFLFRVMEVAGVTRWDDLKGKTIRVKADHCRVEAIGHIVKDDWFTPAEDMRKAGPNAEHDISIERRKAMKVFVWNRVGTCTDNYHSEGGVVVFAQDEERARTIANAVEGCAIKPDEKPDDVRDTTGEEAVYIMQDAGCC